MDFDPDALRRQIPYYLTEENRQGFIKELESLIRSGGTNIFLSNHHHDSKDFLLQGDGWRGFEFFLFEEGKKLSVKGIVISNSCDTHPDNPRDIPTRVIFAPLVRLSAFRTLLVQSGIDREQVENKIQAIKSQKTSNIFFIAAGNKLEEDYIVRLDDIHSMPVTRHQEHPERERIFTLNMSGFYLFVFKLSVHFCRLQEGITRWPVIGDAE